MKPLTWMRAVRDSDLPRTVKATAYVIGLRADSRSGSCWPSYDLIAQDCGAARRDVIRRVKVLREQGWLLVAQRANGHGNQSNSYQLTTPRTLWKTPEGGDTAPTPLVTPDPPRSDTRPTPQGVTPDPPRRVLVKEVGEEAHSAPVDSPHLAAVIGLMNRQHRIP